jgi:hypothetical protein
MGWGPGESRAGEGRAQRRARCAAELQSRMQRAIARPEYGTSFAGMRTRWPLGREMSKEDIALFSCALALQRQRREWNSDLARVGANWEPHVSGRRSWKPSCGCEWPATCLTTVVLSRTGWPYVDRSKGKIVDELDSAEADKRSAFVVMSCADERRLCL